MSDWEIVPESEVPTVGAEVVIKSIPPPIDISAIKEFRILYILFMGESEILTQMLYDANLEELHFNHPFNPLFNHLKSPSDTLTKYKVFVETNKEWFTPFGHERTMVILNVDVYLSFLRTMRYMANSNLDPKTCKKILHTFDNLTKMIGDIVNGFDGIKNIASHIQKEFKDEECLRDIPDDQI